jgi:hypothetical protein
MAFTVTHEYDDKTFGGGCFTCGAPRRNQQFRPGGEMLIDLGPLVDTVEDLDGNLHGFKKPIICETCVRELAVMVGCITPTQVERDNIDHLKVENSRLTKRVNELEGVMDRFREVSA